MLAILHVIVDIDLDRIDVDIVVGVAGQGSERRLFKRLAAVARKLLERLLVQFIEQGTDTLVQLRQREEGVMAQARQDLALDDLHANFGFGLILRLVGPCRNRHHLVVLGPLLITRIEIGVVATRSGDTTA